MRKPKLILFVVIIGSALLLSACVPGPRVVGTPGISVSDDLVYVSYSNFVYGLDIDSGAVQWHYPDEADNQVVFYAPPLVTDDFIYVGDLSNNFHKLDKETGNALWTFSDARGYYIGQASEENGNVYVPSNDGRLYALDTDGNLLWAFETEHYIWAQPQISSEAIFVASMDHFVYAITKSGDEIWSAELNGAVVGSPVLSDDENTLFAGSVGLDMVALDTATGSRLWTFNTDKSVWGRAVFADDTLFFVDSGGNLYALDPATGDLLWRVEFSGPVVGGLTGIEDGFVLATKEGVLRAFNYDGSPKWEATLAGDIFQAPAANGEYLVAGTIDGENLVYGFNLAGVQLWSTTPEN